MLDAASLSANILGLSFHPDKCASLSFTNSKCVDHRFEINDFIVQDQVMPALNDEEHYRYLSIPIGIIHNCNNLSTLVQNLIIDLEKIGQSLLSPWQKLDAIRTFTQPCLTFVLHVGFSPKKSLESYRLTLIKILQKICELPSRSSPAYFFANKHTGGFGLQDPIKELDVQTVVHAIKCFHLMTQLFPKLQEQNFYKQFGMPLNPIQLRL